MARTKAPKDRTGREVKKAQALEYRIAGLSYPKIAERLGCSLGSAHKFVSDALEDQREYTKEKAQELIEIETARIDDVIAKMQEGADRGDTQAAAVILRATQTRAKLLGLNAPERQSIEHSGQVVTYSLPSNNRES